MRRTLLIISLLSLLVSCKDTTKQKKEESECVGDILWQELKKIPIEYELDLVLDTLRKNATLIRKPSIAPQATLSRYITKSYEEQSQRALERANAFFNNLASKQNLNVLEPGKLAFRVLCVGSGPKIDENASPLLHFSEQDLDGDVLYNTHDSPMRISLAETILGFKLGVSGMRVGEKREIFVHPDFAYKKLGKTKPNQLLIYEVTALEQ